MIEDSKFVQSVVSNSPKKGWKITWHDEKKDNIFDEAWLKILDQAQREQRMVHFTKEKNEAGWWNVLTLELATLEAEPTKPAVEESAMPKEKPVTHYDPSGQERGMWWKQLGDDLRSGHVDRTTSLGKALRKCYFAEMFKVLDITITIDEEVK